MQKKKKANIPKSYQGSYWNFIIMGFIKTIFLRLHIAYLLRYFMQSPDYFVNFTLLLELPGNRLSVPWERILYQKWHIVSLVFILQLASAAVFLFHGHFQLINSSLSSRSSCLNSWKIDLYFGCCILLFAMLQPGLIFSSHPTSKSFSSIGPINV